MNVTEWIIFFLLVQLIHGAATWKLYIKAGKKAWQAFVPVYNSLVLMEIINRPKWWVILLFIPIVNLLMFPVVWIETIRSFGRNSTLDSWLVVLTLGFYIFYVSYGLDVEYVENRSLQPRTALGEWVGSIVFAIIAATLVHTYFMQPYVIPTGSLERTLRIGDLLFVSKVHYGARAPMTTIAAPMVHDTLPLLGIKSYLNFPQLPYFRFPGFEEVEKNDIVVFSWPADTVRVFFKKEKGVKKPIDKKSNYVKRCVGTPGDSLSVRDGIVYINGKELQLSDRAKPQFDYWIYSQKGVSSRMLASMGIVEFNRTYLSAPLNQAQVNAIGPYILGGGPNEKGELEIVTKASGIPMKVVRSAGLSLREVSPRKRMVPLTEDMVAELRNQTAIDSVVKHVEPLGTAGYNIFPHHPSYPWNNDNFGPIYIPGKGDEVVITTETLPLYKKIIKDYEGKTISVNGNQISIDGQLTDTYTFEQDYFWMMGDNRDHSEDSRTWGYVPENHIVGKPVFIWLSFDNFNDGIANWSPRWDRIFTTVGGDGEPRSYLPHFLIALATLFVWDYFRKRRKKKDGS